MKKKNYAAIAVALVTGGLSARGAKAGLFQTPVINGTFDYDYINNPNVNYGYDYQLHGWFRAYGGEEWYANAGNNGNDPPVSFPGTFNNSAYAVLSGRDRGSTANTTTGEIYQQIGTVPAATTTINVSFLEAYLKGSPAPLVVSLFSGGSPVQNYSGYTGAAGVYGPSYSLTGAKLLSSVTLTTPSAADAFVQETAALNTSGGTPNSTLWLDFTVNNASFDTDQIGLDNVVVTGPATTQLKWNGSTGAWNTTSTSWKNGSTSTVYSDGTAVTFDDTATSTAITINTANVSPTEIFFNNSSKNYTISGTYGIAGGAQITKTGTGTVTITNANSFTGNVNISAGVVNVQNSLGLGASTGVSVSSGATLQLQGGISIGAMPTTLAGSGTGGAGLDGSLVNVSGSNTYAGQILIASSTTIAVDGGTLNLSSPDDVIANSTENGSNYNLTLSGSGSGTIAGKVGGSGGLIKTGTGSWTLPAAAYFVGGLQVSGGTIILGGANYFQGGLTINGGTAVLTGQNSYSGGTTVNAGTLMIGDGTSGHDGTLPADGSTVTDNGTIVFNTFGSVTYAGNISGTGNLMKSGAGTLILSSSGSANVSGINVSAGKLYVNSTPNSSVSVASGGTLGGNGEIFGSVTVAAGGSIEGGFGGTGTLLISGPLSFAGAGSVNVGTLSNYSSSFALQVNQTLSVASGSTVAVSVANLSGASTGTSYQLIRYGDATTDPGLSAFTLSLPRGDVGTLSDANSSIDLTLSTIGAAAPIVWTGAANAANGWDTTTKNWTYNGSSTAYIDVPGDAVIFDDTAGSNQTVAIKSGDVHPTSVTFNNSTYAYTITGPNAIAGSTALTVNGTGTVILENANSYSGGTFINSGTLQLGNGTSGHDGSIPTAGGLIDNGTLVFDNYAATTFSGVINGSTGSVVQSGPGALTLTAAQNLDTGTLTVSPGSTLTLAPIVSNVPAYSTQDFTSITVGSGATLNVATVHTFGYAGGTRPSITINGGTVTNSLGNDNYLGAVTMTGGTINGTGEFRLQNNLSQTASTLTTLPSSTTATVSVSSFALVSYYSNPVIFNISQGTTTSGIDLLITSNIDNSANLTKIGPGVMEITGSDTYSGGTNVSGGTLILASSGAFPANTPLALSGTGLVVAASHTGATKNNIVALGLSISGGAGAWNGQLDLKNNDMIVRGSNYSYTSGSNSYSGSASLANITSQAAEGYNNGAWNGSGGIISSTAAADTTHLHAVGVILNDNGTNSSTALYTSFDGTTTPQGDVLVKYTYYGDANLDGKVDGTDYGRIDNGYLNNLTGWFNGDFNYDGVIDGSDYTLIDNAYNTQGAQVSSQIATSSAQIAVGSSVPEPATLGLLGMGAVGLLGRRKRKS